MNNFEIVKIILKKCEKGHINLYHSITKQDIENHINTIDWNNLSNLEFDKEMLKLFAMFKDSHTLYFTKELFLSKELYYIGKQVYLKDNNNYYLVKKIENQEVQEVINKIIPLLAYENHQRRDYLIQEKLNNGYYYKILGLADKNVNIEIYDGEKTRNYNLKIKKNINIHKITPYDYKILNNNILYIRYSECYEDKCNPFVAFVKKIEKDVISNNIKYYILDLRNNIGGNSQIIKPLIRLVRKLKLKGVLIINRSVFSSGRIAVINFIEEFKVPLVGEATGGSAKSYGYNKNDEVEGKKFSYSIKLWDFSDIVGYTGAIMPDIYVPLTIDDLKNNIDKQLITSMDLINKIKKEEEK